MYITNPDLFQQIKSKTSLTPEEFASFELLLNQHVFKSNHLLLSPGEICRNISFIIKGCIIAYAVDENGNEKVLNIITENRWVGDFDSFWSTRESGLYLKTVGPTEVLLLNRLAFSTAIENKNILKYMFLILMERNVELERKLLFKTRTNAALRYLTIYENCPDIIKNVPLHYIASYIGITPQSLSRLRKSIQHSQKTNIKLAS